MTLRILGTVGAALLLMAGCALPDDNAAWIELEEQADVDRLWHARGRTGSPPAFVIMKEGDPSVRAWVVYGPNATDGDLDHERRHVRCRCIWKGHHQEYGSDALRSSAAN